MATAHPSVLDTPLFFLLFFFFLIFLPFLFKWLLDSPRRARKNLPPSPPKLPLVGNLHQLGTSPHRTLSRLSRRHGPLMLVHFGSVPVLVASSAAAAHEVLRTHDLAFSSRTKRSIAHRLLYDSKDVAAAPYGEYWRQVRSIAVLHLLSNRRVDGFRAVRLEETALLIGNIKKAAGAKAVDLSAMLMGLTNDVVCRVALGRKYGGGEEGGRFRELLKEFLELLGVFDLGDFVPWLSWVKRFNGLDAKVERVFGAFDSFLDQVVKDHIDRRCQDDGRGDEQKDFVDVLLGIQRENSFGFPMDGDTVKALILDIFVAGTDTTFTVLEWAMTELLRHPHIMKKLQSEVRGIGPKKSSILTEDELQRLPYLKAVIKETLRLHPPIPLLVPRQSTQDVKLQQGYDVAAGTMTIINTWAIGRDPASWGEDAEEFRPERFLNSSVDFKGRDFELIPFGAGRRGCPGIGFAMATDEPALANLAREFDWGVTGEGVDASESVGLTIHRKSPLMAVATPHPWPEL